MDKRRLKVIVVLHEATRTGAPRVGGLVASSLRSISDVKLICLAGGPLWDWLSARVGQRIELVSRGPVHLASFDARVEIARSYLQEQDADLVYVNSLAASEYVVAAKALGMKVVLHVHEKMEEIKSLLRQQVTKYNVQSLCDGIILAGDDLGRDLEAVLGPNHVPTLKWGIAVDFDEVRTLAAEELGTAKNVQGDQLSSGPAVLVGMVGHASNRKGADIFLEVAEAIPNANFLWVGAWSVNEAPENAAADERLLKANLSNVYLAGGVDNPFKYIKALDLFFLSSREDPNPVVLAEAILLQVPILCFSKTTAVSQFLARNGIVIYGKANANRAAKLIGKLTKADLSSSAFRMSLDDARDYFDISRKSGAIHAFLDQIRIM